MSYDELYPAPLKPKLEELWQGLAQRPPMILALDPGETTGWSLISCKLEGDNISGMLPDPKNNGLAPGWSHGQIDCGRARGQLSIDQGTGDPLGGPNDIGEAMGVDDIMYIVNQNQTAAIVVEDFIVDFGQLKKDRSGLSPVRITARLAQALWQQRYPDDSWDREYGPSGRRIILQDRANAKSTMNDDRLRDIGMYERKGSLNHARDADRHAIYFMRRCMRSPRLRHQAWPWLFSEPELQVKRPRNNKPKDKGQRIVFGD